MENEVIKEEVKEKSDSEKIYEEVPYDEAVNKVGLRARKEMMNEELKEGFMKFNGLFSWNGANDSAYAECGLTCKTTKITLYDVNVKYIDDNGIMKEDIADIFNVSVLYKGELLDNFNRKLDDKENYSIVIEFEVEDKKYKKTYNYDRLNLSKKQETEKCQYVYKKGFIWDNLFCGTP